MKWKNTDGFTLLEVLVALAILAITLLAVIKTAGSNADNAAYLRDKTLAHWIAMNVLTELRVNEQWPSVGEQKGDAEMADQRWYWTLTVSNTVDDQLRELSVSVFRQEKDKSPITVLNGYIGQPDEKKI